MRTGTRRHSSIPKVSIVLPVYNAADTLAPVVESVLAQTYPDLELIISDNASDDGTQELCRHFAHEDRRVKYHRQASNVGVLNNFVSAAERASGTYLRWIGDDDWLHPDFVSRVVEVFVEDPDLALVTTQVVYRDGQGVESLETTYDGAVMASPDPVERFSGMLRMLANDLVLVDPLYAMIRRDLATLPRKNMMREDQVFAARLALAGPWGHVPSPLAGRGRDQDTPLEVARMLGVPTWHRHVRVLLQCHELLHWVGVSSLNPVQRRRARTEIARFYAHDKWAVARRRAANLERMAGLPARVATIGAR